MQVEYFLKKIGADFFTGVPDSLLKPLCNYLMKTYGTDKRHHIIAANEGNCVGIAAGYHLATRKVPVVYLQNSGEGNIINPITSLLNEKVYSIPMIFVIGWRGEPGVHDEPQHIFQGEITESLMHEVGVETFVIDKTTLDDELSDVMLEFHKKLSEGKQVAFIVRKGAFEYDGKVEYTNDYVLNREDVIRHIIKYSGDDPIISTTGKASRELFEARVAAGMTNSYDFLTVGSMGHCSSIALGVAINKPERKVWCIDGDGAALMHMGAMPVIGKAAPDNLVHIVINNEAHETVGGLPTAATNVSFKDIAKNCGYKGFERVDNAEALDVALRVAKEFKGLYLIEIMSSIGAREDLGRPTTTAIENKNNFIEYIISI